MRRFPRLLIDWLLEPYLIASAAGCAAWWGLQNGLDWVGRTARLTCP